MNLLLQSMLEAHPQNAAGNGKVLADALEALAVCQQVCTSCADACLAEEAMEHLRECIRQNLDCAMVCMATGSLLARFHHARASAMHAQLHACVLACQNCADVCAGHGEKHEHCAICAETCRRCQEKCNLALGELSDSGVVASE